ncbi:dihydroorotase [Sediminicurvatus halobius]|uniref:Dihydroorotase n=1 Tax=Sediminicurvatus halobius TaxID=2182432 RepID=A0A2U2MYV6_9GAMM|nr:dihydroorotase [Spiribacter halobius]PWG61982.1 dihydroorotase [Spiribacter halobius]UEX78388.1 dihydroorotase [Spiribacter halobius]
MSRILIRGGRLLDPASGHDAVGDLAIAGGRIVGLGAPPDGFAADRVIGAEGCWVLPGLIDLAARLREPGATHKADIASEARAAAAAGITTLVLPPDTEPVLDTPSVAELVHRRAAAAGGARVVPLAALTLGLAGEQLAPMAALADAGCPAVADGGRPVADTLVLRRALEYAATYELPALLTPWDPWLAAGGGLHEGPVAMRLGLPGVSVAAETAGLGRQLAVATALGLRVHFGRLSTAAGAAMLRNAHRDGAPVTGDVAIHQLFLTENDAVGYDSRFHVQPPLRSVGDRDALRRAVADGTLGIICSDHQPHERDAKDGPFTGTEPGLSGIDTLLALVLRLVEEEAIGLLPALAAVTAHPAALLGLDTGRLATGAPADVCIVDPQSPWWCRAESLGSRGRHNGFLGWEFSARNTHTLVNGELVHGDAESG